jgi:phosphoglycolate phosphatase-like HAD superfamily hydrolase
MSLRGGLIDWDGTIVKTPERQFKWYREWARQNNIPFEYDSLESWLPMYNSHINDSGVQGVYDALGLPGDVANFEDLVWVAYNAFKKSNPVEMYDGIREALIDVWKIGRLDSNAERNHTLRLAINTTNNWGSIYPDLKKFDMDYIFDSFCTAETLNDFVGEGGDTKGIHKPSKVSIALMLHILGTDGETTFHLGDTIADLRASYDIRRHGGIKSESLITVGASWGFEGRTVLEKGYVPKDSNQGSIHFTHIIDEPRQLVDIVKLYR